MSLSLALVPLLLWQIAMVSAAVSYVQKYSAPKISLDQLQENNINLHKILHESGGVLRISVNSKYSNNKSNFQEISDDSLIDNISSFRKEALTALCTCSAFQKSTSSVPNSNDLFKQLLETHPNDVQQIELPDGSTRRTLATATVGFDGNHADPASSHPLQLPLWFKLQCGADAYNSLENLRDAVSHITSLFVNKLDDEMQRDRSYRHTLQSTNHLEHFHIYFKKGATGNEELSMIHNESSNGKMGYEPLPPTAEADVKKTGTPKTITLDYHTDAGFFLSFVPAMNCHSYSVDDSSFYVKPLEEPLKFEANEVVILMGAGAQYWMNNNPDIGIKDSHSFVAAPHALRLLPDAHRAWYGKMHLLPSSLTSNAFNAATPLGRSSSSHVRYGDVLPTFQLENYKAYVPSSPVDGCGINPLEHPETVIPTSLPRAERHHSRRRLQHVGSPANCNNETDFFCWYQCLSIPDADYTIDYLRDGYSLYCLDPSMLSDSSVADAAAPCKKGYTHNSDCSGSWQIKVVSLPGYEFPNYAATLEEEKSAATYPAIDDGQQYCYGGTSMYMDGFNWIGSTCVIYLFPQWTLSTSGKFAMACIGSILLGILLEYMLRKRKAVYTMNPGTRRFTLSVLMYGLQLTMGYFIMLVIMTYSGPLFVSTIGGMMIGHALFNAQDSFVKWRDERDAANNGQEAGVGTCENGPTERASTELASTYQNVMTSSQNSSEVDEEAETIGGCCGLGMTASAEKPFGVTEKTKLRENITDGVTPCCQYVL